MSEERRPIAVDDLYKIITVEEPRISPDGQWIAFVQVTLDKMENTYYRNIWLKATDGGDAFQLTRSNKDFMPRWSPDGKTLGFVSARADKPQVYLLPVAGPGGEAQQATKAQNGVGGFSWSPDGALIAYTAPMDADERAKEDSDEKEEPPADAFEAKQRKERREEDERMRYDPRWMWRVPYRTGTSFISDRYAQVYVVPVDESLEGDDAKPRRLTDIDGNHGVPEWSPDGQYLYTSRQLDVTADEPFVSTGLFRIRVSDGELTQLTDADYMAFAPTPSPDGQWIAYVRAPREGEGFLEANSTLVIMPVAGGETRDLTLTLDRDPNSFDWTPDSQSLVFTAPTDGVTPVYRASLTGEVETLAKGIFDGGDVFAGENLVVFTASTPTQPTELFAVVDGAVKVLTDFNAKWLSEVIIQETHSLNFKSPSGIELQGWYILPVGYEEGQKYPLALNIHGGPRAMWSPATLSMFHEWQLHAASGYVVFYCNPRGADGYGEAFKRELHQAWGEVAFDDIMAGVDAVVNKGFVDEDRMAVTGGSYGGYMTAWIVGHTDRFKAAVSQRGVYNLVSFYGTTDIPILISADFHTEPWENHELLWKHSPLAYAHNVKTPLLIVHSENDYRVPIEQAEQLFAWVRRSGGTVKMVRYPRDGHELSRSGEPKHRVSRLTEMVKWFDTYCKSE